MARRRRTDTPMVLLVMGLFSIVLFGVAVVHFSNKTPILRLRPQLEEAFGTAPIAARFRMGSPPWIEVQVPPALGDDPVSRARVGAVALAEYRKIAPDTRVDSVLVRVVDAEGETSASSHITLAMGRRFQQAEASLELLVENVRRAGLPYAEVRLVGLETGGVVVEVSGTARTPEQVEQAAAAAKRAAERVVGFPFVQGVGVRIQTPAGEVTAAEGRGVPPVERQPQPQ